MSAAQRWREELEAPTPGFFEAFAALAGEAESLRDALREGVKTLVPRVDWEAYLPHVPHGILGLRAVLRLRPILSPASFLRALATQLHMAAHEGRRTPAALAQARAAKGSGDWKNLEAFVRARRPSLAYAEAQGVETPEAEAFTRLGSWVAQDMANVGHKAVVADHAGDLFEQLERPRATGRRLLGLAAWLAATPEDTFWARRAERRLGDASRDMPVLPSTAAAEALAEGVREVCDLGLVGLLDRIGVRLRAGLGTGDALALLVLAAAEKQLDARRDLEGKTAWNFVYLATLARQGTSDPKAWCQAAALVNLFPTDEPEDRVRPEPVADPTPGRLLDAVLDAEPALAMGHARALLDLGRAGEVIGVLAEAATKNDPAFNHAHQVLAVAAAADLWDHLPGYVRASMLMALAKNLANSQGSSDLGRRADQALQRR